MTALKQTRLGNGVAPHFDPEPFSVVAYRELAAHPFAPAGVCQNPTCSRHFAPTRDWQVYCCEACRRADVSEMRRVGLKAAPALLAWRLGKYEDTDPALRALSRAGRRYVGTVQSDWLQSRRARISAAGAA